MIEIKETLYEHLPYLWEIIQEHGVQKYFSDGFIPQSPEEFIRWWEQDVDFSLTGLDDGIPVGVGYLNTISVGYTANINIFKKKGYLKTEMVAKIMKEALPTMFDRFHLERISGITRTNNKACLRLLKLIGLKIDGRIRHFNKVGGKWQDYYLVSILKDELNKKTIWSFVLWVKLKKDQLMSLLPKKDRRKKAMIR